MIALLSSSNVLCQNSNSSTGDEDSVYVSIEDLRIANIKMTQLKYATEEIKLKNNIISLDSIEIKTLNDRITSVNKENKKLKKQRNILVIIAGVLLGATIGISL